MCNVRLVIILLLFLWNKEEKDHAGTLQVSLHTWKIVPLVQKYMWTPTTAYYVPSAFLSSTNKAVTGA